MERLETLKRALLTCSEQTHHLTAGNSEAPFIVWQETGDDASYAGDAREERSFSALVSLYTAAEHDALIGKIEAAFAAHEIGFSLDATLYEADTGLFHYAWSVEVD